MMNNKIIIKPSLIRWMNGWITLTKANIEQKKKNNIRKQALNCLDNNGILSL